MAQRDNNDRFNRNQGDGSAETHRSGYGYQQDMPQRNDFGGHRGRNELDQQRQIRGMSQKEWQDFEQPQSYRMDFDRNRQSYSSYDRRREGPRNAFDRQGNSPYDRDDYSSTADMGVRSASSDMPSADRYRTRGFDDDGPGLYAGAEDFGHAGYQDRFEYGSNRYPNPDLERQQYSRRTENGSARWDGDFQQRGGAHRGKGPKNYTRSDDRIREDICEYLMQDSNIDATEIDVAVSSGEVTLSGTVNTKQEKRRTEDIIDRISGVKDVHNQIRIASTSNSSSDSSSMGSSGSDGNGSQNASKSGSRGQTRVS